MEPLVLLTIILVIPLKGTSDLAPYITVSYCEFGSSSIVFDGGIITSERSLSIKVNISSLLVCTSFII